MDSSLLIALLLADPQAAPIADRAVTYAQPLMAQAAPAAVIVLPETASQEPVQPAPDGEAAPPLPPTGDTAGEPANADGGAPEAGPEVGDVPPEDEGNVIIVEGRPGAPPGDPLIEINEEVATVLLAVDDAVIEPIADAYRDDLPKPVRNGLRNFFRNLREPINFLNFLLQLKPKSALETLGRFVVNSTAGVAGIFDVAGGRDVNLPYRQNGFANTLGYYGVGPGPFLVLPLIGATTVRDLIGSTLDTAVLPAAVGRPFDTAYYAVPAYTINSLQARIEFDDELEQIKAADAPYDELKRIYLERREREIAALRGEEPASATDRIPSETDPDPAPAGQ